MTDNVSPEEKLLRLIRGQKKQTVSGAKEKLAPASVFAGPQVDSKHILKGGFAPAKAKRQFSVNLNIALWVALGFSFLILLISFIYPVVTSGIVRVPEFGDLDSLGNKTDSPKSEKSLEFYLSGIKSAQIFNSVQEQEITKAPGAISADLIKDLSLVGIMSGVKPQAIIEDKKAQKTYYLYKGQFVSEFKVEDIQEGKVILSYKGDSFELYL